MYLEELSVASSFSAASEALDEGCLDVSLAFEHKGIKYSECEVFDYFEAENGREV